MSEGEIRILLPILYATREHYADSIRKINSGMVMVCSKREGRQDMSKEAEEFRKFYNQELHHISERIKELETQLSDIIKNRDNKADTAV